MSPGWYSVRGIAVHWFQDFSRRSATSLCGLIALTRGLQQGHGSFCMSCELQRQELSGEQ
jgi:hypothetical protein